MDVLKKEKDKHLGLRIDSELHYTGIHLFLTALLEVAPFFEFYKAVKVPHHPCRSAAP